MQTLLLLQLLDPGGKRLVQGLLFFKCLRNPKNIVIAIGIHLTYVSGDNVVFVPGWGFERKFAFDCDSSALGIEGGQVRANVVL